MDDIVELASDRSSSNQTIVIENNELDNILKKYTSGDFSIPFSSKTLALKTGLEETANLPTTSKEVPKRNIYNLDDFSDEDLNYEPLEKKINSAVNQNNSNRTGLSSSWQEKFSVEDFCEDSNDIDAVLNRISQLESEQFPDRPDPQLSRELQNLLTGDIIERPNSKPKENSGFSNESKSSSSTENSNDFDSFKKKINFKFDPKLSEADSLKSEDSILGSEINISDEPKTKKLKKSFNRDQILDKEATKAIKAKERERKRLEKENQKQLKSALKVVENCVRPDQCLEYITVNIDESLSNKHYGEVIKAGLNSAGYNYKVSKQLVSNLISWTRKVPTLENMLLQNVFQQEKHYLLVMDNPEFLGHVSRGTLVSHIQSLISKPEIDHLSIALLGLPLYYKHLRNQRNREFKAAVATSDINRKQNKGLDDLPKVTRIDIEMKLVELQIFCKNLYVRPVEKLEDLAVFVGECTKAVAQIPYKKAKQESLTQENEFFMVNNKDCVKVDKDGNGLGRLWNQFLRMFPLASLETAEAVSSVYPTMNALTKAYQNCKSPEDAEKLLQDLPVRRAAGPLSGHRKIGPEFSKKAYKFFCSSENVSL